MDYLQLFLLIYILIGVMNVISFLFSGQAKEVLKNEIHLFSLSLFIFWGIIVSPVMIIWFFFKNLWKGAKEDNED